MGDRIGIARVLGSFFRLSIGLVAITTGDVRCLFDVLRRDLVVKGTQQELVHLLLTVSYRKHGSHDTSGMPRKINSVHGVAEYIAVAF